MGSSVGVPVVAYLSVVLRSVTALIKWSVHSISCSRSILPGRPGGGRQMAPKDTREWDGMSMALNTESAAGVPET